MRDVNNIRQVVYFARRAVFPTIPKNLADSILQFKTSTVKTIKGENFIEYVDEVNSIVILTCDSNLRHLCASDKVYMDGTFEYAPKHWYQLFTIHMIKNNHYIPAVFCLLPNKKKLPT